MFYNHQPEEQRQKYKRMLSIIGGLSRLFSDSSNPYLYYRAHENIFCKYFDAENIARHDCSADAKKGVTGIGLKTWVDQDDQKVAEFGRLRNTYAELSGIELVTKIAEYRNERIRVTKNLHGLANMIYHVVKRIPGSMQIFECAFDSIDIDNITIIENRGNNNNTYFTDGRHTYHFSSSKNTLFMLFEDMEPLDSIEVEIIDDPYSFLMDREGATAEGENNETEPRSPEQEEPVLQQLCLRLYSTKPCGTKYVADRSGLNQWKAAGRTRDLDEIYIPYPKPDRERNPAFFPARDTVFSLTLPDGTVIPAKVCQEAYRKMPDEQYNLLSEAEKAIEDARRLEGKAIMSNPNKVLGKWLLRDVFEVPYGTPITYDMLQRFGIDSVIFTKHGDLDYSVEFSEIGTYEDFYENDL